MNSPSQTPEPGLPAATQRNPDLAEQALPGYSAPSQKPEAGARVGFIPSESERESKSAHVGGGALAGMAAGAAAGAVIAGPVGGLVGATAGTIAGALGGDAAGPGSRADMDHLPVEAEIRSEDDDAPRRD